MVGCYNKSECHAKKVDRYPQGQGDSEGSSPQEMTVRSISYELWHFLQRTFV